MCNQQERVDWLVTTFYAGVFVVLAAMWVGIVKGLQALWS
jgi:hypothetical protein